MATRWRLGISITMGATRSSRAFAGRDFRCTFLAPMMRRASIGPGPCSTREGGRARIARLLISVDLDRPRLLVMGRARGMSRCIRRRVGETLFDAEALRRGVKRPRLVLDHREIWWVFAGVACSGANGGGVKV